MSASHPVSSSSLSYKVAFLTEKSAKLGAHIYSALPTPLRSHLPLCATVTFAAAVLTYYSSNRFLRASLTVLGKELSLRHLLLFSLTLVEGGLVLAMNRRDEGMSMKKTPEQVEKPVPAPAHRADEHHKPVEVTSDQETLLEAARNGNVGLIQSFLKNPTLLTYVPEMLLGASESGRANVMELILPILIKDRNSFIFWILRSYFPMLQLAVTSRCPEVINALVSTELFQAVQQLDMCYQLSAIAALQNALQQAVAISHPATIKALLNMPLRSELTEVNREQPWGWPNMLCNANPAVLKTCIDHQPPIRCAAKDWVSLLMDAVSLQNEDTVRALVAGKQSLPITEEEWQTASVKAQGNIKEILEEVIRVREKKAK